MLERIYIKNHLSFGDVRLEFDSGLSVITGVSGAGKSVLINALLSVFGLSEIESGGIIEADSRANFDMDEFGIASESPNNFRVIKEKSSRYFINSQMISKRNLNLISGGYIKFLGAKNQDEINSQNLLNLLDNLVKDKTHFKNLELLRAKFGEFLEIKRELKKLKDEENKIEELREFAKFEIDKIEGISPKIGEYDELMDIKKKLSKKDKIEEAWDRAEEIFRLEGSVVEALSLSGFDSGFFEDAMNELRMKREELDLEELESLDIEQILDRISSLSELNRRYGSVEEALETLKKRKNELEHYENISFEMGDLEKKFSVLEGEVLRLAGEISKNRKSVENSLKDRINRYLSELYMSSIDLIFSQKETDFSGSDEVSVVINGTEFKNLSSGETNRLKLAFIAASLDVLNSGGGVLILDEIDSNLSGKEAMSIAEVLVKISKFYQIFAISHQPQLSSKANSHFLVTKGGNISSVKKLNEDEKIDELSRMISGEVITKEAREFAKKLRNSD